MKKILLITILFLCFSCTNHENSSSYQLSSNNEDISEDLSSYVSSSESKYTTSESSPSSVYTLSESSSSQSLESNFNTSGYIEFPPVY